MLIPINNLSRYGSIIGSTYYDTVSRKTIESDVANRDLPILDIMSYELSGGSHLCTVIGKDFENGHFVVSFGDSYLCSLPQNGLRNYHVSNLAFLVDGNVNCIDGPLEDYSDLFENKNILFNRIIFQEQKSSIGIAKKFLASINGDLYFCKFKKLTDKELLYEELYSKIGMEFDIPVCECFTTIYGGRVCACSKMEFDPDKDTFIAFKNFGKTTGKIYQGLSKENQEILDRFLLLDYIMLQQDRHMSNLAMCNGVMYPLFDNGECLNLGVIGHFSNAYRDYILRKDTNYIRGLVKNIEEMPGFVKKSEFELEAEIVAKEMEDLFHGDK